MAKSPLLKQEAELNLLIKVAGKEISQKHLVRSIEVIKELNKIPFAEITIRDGDSSEQTFEDSEGSVFLPGKEIEILVGFDTTAESIFKGIIVGQKLRIKKSGSNLILKCNDKAIAMTVGRKSMYFLKKKDSDIMSTLIKGHSLKATVKATSYQHKEMVQYHCTDWDFVLNRAEVNGLVVSVSEGEVKVGPPEPTKAAKLMISYGLDMIDFDGEIDGRNQYPSVTCYAWDMKTQKMVKGEGKDPKMDKPGDLKGSKLAKDVGIKKPLEFHTSGPVEDKMLKEWAAGKMIRSRLSRIRGNVSFQGSPMVEPGGTIELAGLGKRFNGVAYVSKVRHVITNGHWVTSATLGLPKTNFNPQADPVSTPAAAGLLPAINGLQIGVVKQIEKDPDGETRILVDVPVIAPSGDGIWARLTNFYASNQVGLFFMPELKDEVILGFLNDDPRYPIILGMVYSSKLKPPYTPEKKNSIKALVTKSKMKIEFDDEKKIIIIETPAGNRVTMSDEKKTLILEDPNKNSITMSDKGIAIESQKDISIAAGGKIGVSGDMGTGVMASSGDVTLDGINIKATGDGQVGIEAAKTEIKGSGMLKLQGGTVMIN